MGSFKSSNFSRNVDSRRASRKKPRRAIGTAPRSWRLGRRLVAEALECRQLLAALMGYSLEVTTNSGEPTSQIVAGQDFKVNLYAEDLRGAGEDRGVGAAYVDIVFTNSSLISAPGTRTFGADYPDIQKPGEAFTGKLNNAGATNFGLSETLGLGRKLVMTIPFTAVAGGSVVFQATSPTADADPGPGDDDYLTYDSILQEPPQTVAPVDIDFGQATLNIINVMAEAGGPYTVNEQSSVSLSGQGIVAPGFTVQSYEWDLDGDGVFAEPGSTARGNERTQNPTFLAGGLDGFAGSTFDVKLRVVARRTSDGQLFTSAVDTATINIANVAPTVAINSVDKTLAATGEPVTIVLSASDVAPADQAAPFTYEINWGDGTTQQLSGPGANASFTYYYSTEGNYQISVKAIDNDGGASTSINHGTLIETFRHRLMSNGDFIVGGTSGDDQIDVRQQSDGRLYVVMNGVASPRFLVPGKIIVYAGPGDDDAAAPYASTRDTLLYGGPGNDRIMGSIGRDSIFGEDGRDALFGREGDDVIRGGDGDDIINGGRGSDLVYGEAGNDRLRGGDDTDTDFDLVFGDAGRDYIVGTTGPEVLHGGDGDDRIGALHSRKILIGGNGRDILEAGPKPEFTTGKHGSIVIGDATVHDANETALRALLAEWASNNSFATRVAHITGTAGGQNGSTFLRTNADIVFETSRDVLIGGHFPDLFYRFGKDFYGPGDPGPEDMEA